MLKRALMLFFLLLLLLILNAFLNPVPEKNVPLGFEPNYGVSYSFEQAGWYSLDPRKSYIELLDSVEFGWVRLPFFWDQMTDENGNLKIEDLEFATREAQKRNVKVVIALGLKTPYYPEYHLPGYIASQLNFGERIGINHPVARDLLEIDRKLVSALSKYDNISHWQIENEPFLANINNWKINKSLLQAEVEVVKGIDGQKRPIILNHVGPSLFDKKYKELLSLLEPNDVLGVNAYFKTQGTYLFTFKILDNEVKVNWPTWLVWPVQSWVGLSPDFSGLEKEAQRAGVNLWILEMQAEPYIRDIESANAVNFFFKPSDIYNADLYLKSHQIHNVGLWGAHFWQFRQKAGDNSWIEAVKSIIN